MKPFPDERAWSWPAARRAATRRLAEQVTRRRATVGWETGTTAPPPWRGLIVASLLCVTAGVAAGVAACAPQPAAVTADSPVGEYLAAREAMGGGGFARAEELFDRLVARDPESPEGRESLFLLGILHLDPRNPAWNPDRGEEELMRYLHLPAPQARRAEALAIFALSRRLASPEDQQAGGGGGGAPQGPITIAQRPSDTELETARLKKELDAKNRENAKLREELERIRRTLTPP